MGKAENHVRSAKGEGESNDEVFTPDAILRPIEQILGPIGLDPCSHPKSIVRSDTAILLPQYAPAIVAGAKRTVYADGLQIVWLGHGLGFMNCPYSAPLMERFLAKARDEASRGWEGLAFVPHRTANRYWPLTAGTADMKIELFDRVRHEGEEHRSPFHQVLLYFGPRLEQALGLAVLGTPVIHPRHLRLNR